MEANNNHSYIPKRLVHTWNGHENGVSAIRFFPNQGHMLLSAGMDTKVKLWDVINRNPNECIRTYNGHTESVKDICFSNDGTRFLTAGFDKKIKYWDTETGQVLLTFSTRYMIPNVVKFNPDDDKQNMFLAGMSGEKIVQWDINNREVTCVYDYDHNLGAVNTITFVDDNKRFVTTSDDKSIRVWEFGKPLLVKYILEPYMKSSIHCVSAHPSGDYLAAAQSFDDQVLVYGIRGRFQLSKKKRFVGHVVKGNACQVSFSPDGRVLMSGDSEGKCWFWDWESCEVVKTLECHSGVCIGAEWHPLEQGKIATCGSDGLIKYWDDDDITEESLGQSRA